jgi:bacterioferritin-associated ferredoxin
MYVCNCNGLREQDVRRAIAGGADRPAAIFRHCQGAAQCAKCVCDMRRMIQESDQALRYAAE